MTENKNWCAERDCNSNSICGWCGYCEQHAVHDHPSGFTLTTDELSGDMSAEAAVRVGRKVGGWIRCSISTCVECHDEDCVNDQHEVLPLTAVGSDILVSCEKCGAALHRD